MFVKNTTGLSGAFFGLIFGALAALMPLAACAASLDTATIESLTGLTGSLDSKTGVFKVTAARTDVQVSVDGWTMPPAMGLTSWAAFKLDSRGVAAVMGDTVLFEDEVNPAMSAALDNGLAVTALHNHYFFDQPRVFFMHIAGRGDQQALARAVRAVQDAVQTVRRAHPQPAQSFGPPVPSPSQISAGPIEQALGTKGKLADGMFKAGFGRQARMPHGLTMDGSMGVGTGVEFAGTDSDAVVFGDFVVKESELQAVLKSLRHDGINVVAIHNHMNFERPRYLFFHYWGRGPAAELARAVRKALDLIH